MYGGSREDALLQNEAEDLLARLYKLIPAQTQDMVAMFVFLVLVPIGFLIEIFYVMGEFYTPFTNPWLVRTAVMSVLALNVIINYILVIRIGPNGKNPLLPNVVQTGFRFCHSCRMNAPPRAYHCPACDSCAFRRDHHCSFAAVCIGHFNQRYFVAAILNLLVITTFFQAYNWEWLSLRMGGFSLLQAWQLMLPHVALLLRAISFTQFVCILFHASCCVTWIFSVYLLSAQIFCLWRGQTRVEYLQDVHAYQLGLLENTRQALGSRWLLALFIPLLPSPLPSAHGTSFSTRDMQQHKSAKSF